MLFYWEFNELPIQMKILGKFVQYLIYYVLMVPYSRIVFYIPAFILILGLYSCMDDEIVRLPTDVTVEGTEMFNTSFTISEHVNLIIKPFERYVELENDTLQLRGCPIVAVNRDERRVTLTFDPNTTCLNNAFRRAGSITLFYTTSLISNEEIVLIEYQDYRVRNNRLEGSRLVTKRTGTELNIYKDTMAQLMVYDEFGSSTRVTAEYEHQLTIGSDFALQINTTGSGGGRNMAGRAFNFTIENQKIQYIRCIEEGIFVPSSGQETWTFERTVTPAVTHRMNFGEGDDCNRNVSIVLSNGETLTLNP